jgi:hypothetical protein
MTSTIEDLKPGDMIIRWSLAHTGHWGFLLILNDGMCKVRWVYDHGTEEIITYDHAHACGWMNGAGNNGRVVVLRNE